ncbi:Uncharacterized protein APZ42_001210, partial [Daphnia magna]
LSLLILLFFSPLLSQLTWIGVNTISIFWTANIHLPLVQHCCFDNFASFAPQCTTRNYIFFVFLSWLSTPSPHRCLR